ncbi:uncharacterized protein LOC134270265 [Saccostrea cucullata]|uniref:uncharacterized protein LOC134270265 n=1 Tax=Saccostrea cuccullata TaxID=36930 RepID=UPI002ED106F1
MANLSVNAEINPSKRQRQDSSVILSGDLSKLNDLLDTISSDENSFKQAVNLIINKENFKSALAEVFVSEITSLRKEVSELTSRLDEMEQYSRRNCLKITGIPEEKGENTDKLVLNVVNSLILKDNTEKITVKDISRSHRVGKYSPGPNKPRDIIAKFVSYREKARVYGNKRNLKSYNHNPSKQTGPIYVNEALTSRRAELYGKTRELVKKKKVDSCWTYDGRIYVKLRGQKGKKIPINTVDNLDCFYEEEDDAIHNEGEQVLASTPIS